MISLRYSKWLAALLLLSGPLVGNAALIPAAPILGQVVEIARGVFEMQLARLTVSLGTHRGSRESPGLQIVQPPGGQRLMRLNPIAGPNECPN